MKQRKSDSRNAEGYMDKTAGEAIRHVSREERGKSMAKRKLKKDKPGYKIHEKAVKLRKMTDSQLVEYVDNRVGIARNEGYNAGRREASENPVDMNAILNDISQLKGIGESKLDKISEVLNKHLAREDEEHTAPAESIGEQVSRMLENMVENACAESEEGE